MHTAWGLSPAVVKVMMSGVAAVVAAAGENFQLQASLVQRVLKGMQAMTGKQVQVPAIVLHE